MPEHRVVLSATVRRDRTIFWHGSTISEQQLIAYLSRAKNVDPTPYFFVLQYERGVGCERLAYYRSLVDTHADCRENGLCSEREVP
jgi:hypothetical protein